MMLLSMPSTVNAEAKRSGCFNKAVLPSNCTWSCCPDSLSEQPAEVERIQVVLRWLIELSQPKVKSTRHKQQ